MKKMEEAALKAYMKDVETNPDFTSQLIKDKMAQKKEKVKQETSAVVKTETEDRAETAPSCSEVKAEPAKLWYEAQSEEGHTYYWHLETGESRWLPPEEGYLSIAEQKDIEKKELIRQVEEEKKKKAEEERLKEEERARLEREKMKSLRLKEEKKSIEYPMPIIGPAPKPDPYGAWKPVDNRIPEPVDLQLPEQEFLQIKIPVAAEPQVKFKEKIISSLGEDEGDSGSVFKKRKFNSNPKRNMRQRLDES
ncbi:hypothetical protein C0J52_05858 [Blattella germanica]|nr:hypothetical protein C0J52_05858 [Blattella germanica]